MTSRLEIDFPPLPSSDYEWSYLFTTDDPNYYPQQKEYQDDIVLGTCDSTIPYTSHSDLKLICSYKDCANVTMGAFSIRIIQVRRKVA